MIKKFSHKWFVELGKKGRATNSPAQQEAAKKNLEKARAKRWPVKKDDI